MLWQLTAKSGSHRGESWTISDCPILIGRNLGCDVHIDDPTVSRRHCQLYLEGDEVFFRDLGSRNVSLVNGTVVAECRLALGDELAIGSSTFILTRTAKIGMPVPEARRDTPPSTVSLAHGEDAGDEDGRTIATTFPTSAKDVFRMFQFGRTLNRARCEEAFASACVTEMEAHFPPEVAIAVWCGAQANSRCYPASLKIPEDLVTQVRSAMVSGRPSLARYRKKGLLFQDHVLACVAPMMVSWQCRGALLVYAGARKHVLNDSDLACLDGIAQTAAPFQLWDEMETRGAAESGRAMEGLVPDPDAGSPQRLASDSGKHTLISGESSAAAALTAQLIHSRSKRASGPYVTVDCHTIAGNGFLHALVGTGEPPEGAPANEHGGLLARSNGGTLVLDNLDRLPLSNQQELAEILRTKTYDSPGSREAQPYSGLIVATVAASPDILAQQHVLDPDLLELLSRQQIVIRPRADFDTNPREEEQVSFPVGTRSFVNTPPPAAVKKDSKRDSSLDALANAEKTLVRAVLTQCNGDVKRAAEIFGVPPSALESMAQDPGGETSTPI